MSLFYEIGFKIKRGREVAFQDWTAKNDAALKASVPAGVEYLGTYVVAMSSEKDLGEYRVLWRLGSYAAFDAFDEAAQDEKGDWGRLNREVTEFMDLPIGAPGHVLGLPPADRSSHVGDQLARRSGPCPLPPAA